jgi:hypothetical protein
MDGLSASVPLLTDTLAELEGDDTTPIHGWAYLTGLWNGQPIECVFRGEGFTTLPSIIPTLLRIKDDITGAMATIRVRALSARLQEPTLFGNIFETSLVPLENSIHVSYSQKDDITKEVVAHLLNVPQYNGAPIRGAAGTGVLEMPARLRFTGGGWKITIDDLAPWAFRHVGNSLNEDNPKKEFQLWIKRYDALKQVPRTGGALLTHALRVERENGSTFGLSRATKILGRIEKFLSFAFGQRTRPLHAHGYDRHHSQKWTIFDVRPPLPTSPTLHGTPSWLPQVGASTDGSDATNSGVDLSSAFDGFVSLAEDPGMLATLDRAIDWYLAALASFGNPASIVLAQAGLELLAWQRITTEMKLSEKGRLSLDAADQLRLLLVGTELPLDIPTELPELSKARLSGPVAVTRARNAAVHPIDSSRLTKTQSTEAHTLAIWYFEMLLLRMVGHDGEYWDRLRRENRLVPWR